MHENTSTIEQSLRTGAQGYVSKREESDGRKLLRHIIDKLCLSGREALRQLAIRSQG